MNTIEIIEGSYHANEAAEPHAFCHTTGDSTILLHREELLDAFDEDPPVTDGQHELHAIAAASAADFILLV
jgi:hypothetical protein